VLIPTWQLRASCAVPVTTTCYLVRDPLDLALAAASAPGGCVGFLCWSARRDKILLGAAGTLNLGGVLAGLAAAAQTQVPVAGGGWP